MVPVDQSMDHRNALGNIVIPWYFDGSKNYWRAR